MGLANQCQGGDGSRLATIAAILLTLFSVSAISPARAQAEAQAPTESRTTLTPGEAQRALDALQDASKRDELIKTLRSIAKVAPVTPAQPTAP